MPRGRSLSPLCRIYVASTSFSLQLTAKFDYHCYPSRPDCLELLLKYDKPVPRYTSFPTAAAFHDGVGPVDLAAQLARPTKAPLSLYVHLPFCRHACWYCGCSRITTQAGSKVVLPYLEALAKELALVARASGSKRSLAQLHWGGGTPNYLTTAEMAQLWGQIERNFDLDSDLEASIELNPEFLSRDGVLSLRRLGFNRVSFGIQDADPDVQAAVNRLVPAEQLRRVMDWLREADFASVNVDLICGLPRQTPERFAATLELVQQLRFATEWLDLRAMEADGLVKLQAGGEIRVTYQGRWLIRTIASLFDPAQRLGASGSRLV